MISLLSAGAPYPRDRQYEIEVFGDTRTPAFRLDAAAAAAADIVFRDLLEPSRLNRVLDQGGRDPGQLGLTELLATTIGSVFAADAGGGGHDAALRRVVETRLVAQLAAAMADKSLSPAAVAVIESALLDLGRRLAAMKNGAPEELALARFYAEILRSPSPDTLKGLLERDAGQPAPPPGMPIGAEGEDDWFAGPGW